jgi:outer membrane immunogenic protein
MKTFAIAAAALGSLAAPAFSAALDYEQAPETPVAMAPVAAPAPVLPSWTGFYAGGQLGWGMGETDIDIGDLSFSEDDDGVIYGIHAGYDYDFGNNWVVGGELAWNRIDFTAEFEGDAEADFDNLVRLTSRAGYSFGNTLAYLTGGAAWLDGSASVDGDGDSGSDWGWVAGLGVEHRITESISGGLEYLYHEVNDFDDQDGLDFNVQTLVARVSYRF